MTETERARVRALGKAMRAKLEVERDLPVNMQAALLQLAVSGLEPRPHAQSSKRNEHEMTEQDDGEEEREQTRLAG